MDLFYSLLSAFPSVSSYHIALLTQGRRSSRGAIIYSLFFTIALVGLGGR